jgi:DNA-binding beta-propeller fold protein YncE
MSAAQQIRLPQIAAIGVGFSLAIALVAGASQFATATAPAAGESSANQIPSPASRLLPSGRQLTPAGDLVTLGTLPMGGAVTDDGRYLWTVSSGIPSNDVRIVDTSTHKVCQILNLPGASGGIALDSTHRRAYVSGLPNSRWQPERSSLPGANGDVVHVIGWTNTCGQARVLRTIAVPPQPGAPTSQSWPAPRGGLTATTLAWPQKLAVSPDGARLLVSLNLANAAAIVDVTNGDRVRYVATGGYPYGAAIVPGDRIGLVSNEGVGTVSVIDLRAGTKLKDITVGTPLSHPAGIVVDKTGRRAYVALSASDQVVVVDIRKRKVERTIWVGRQAGLGTMPVAVALSPSGTRLFVAESGADELAVIALPGAGTATSQRWKVVGRIPTASQPQAVATSRATATRPAQLLYVSAEGLGIGPNVNGPNPTLATDPIFWAFSPNAPTFDVFGDVGYTAKLVRGQAGLMDLPTDAQVRALTPSASQQLIPSNAQAAPENTVLRANGPIKHVFFIVRENRSYDQILGDDPRGNGDPKLTLFGKEVTPNLHALTTRFPLLDNVFANSEASIQGHFWTAAATVPDYVTRNWVQQYAGRGRPNDFGTYAVSWPGNGLLFNRAQEQGISYFNYGEGFIGGYTSVPDRERTPEVLAMIAATQAHSDLNSPLGGCYASDLFIGAMPDGSLIFDSTLPAGAPAGSSSHVDCFRTHFAQQLAANDVPAFNYLTLTSDHTRGTQPGFPMPTSMVADSDLALGQLVETISHSNIWDSSAIFVVEDDSQDGSDHVNAHRIPVAVISPYAKVGAVLHNRYDLLSVVLSMELILGMKPLSLNDAMATPMYDAFGTSPTNAAPITAIVPDVDLLKMNTATSPDAEWSRKLPLGSPDQVPQSILDAILWHSVHGASSTPPPPGPGAEGEEASEAIPAK